MKIDVEEMEIVFSEISYSLHNHPAHKFGGMGHTESVLHALELCESANATARARSDEHYGYLIDAAASLLTAALRCREIMREKRGAEPLKGAD